MAKQAKRGFMPTDERDFSDKAQTVLRKAAEEVGYLLDRGYPVKSVTTFVGNHYLLSERQRLALARVVSPQENIAERKAKEVGADELSGETLYIDGFNTVISLEIAYSQSMLFRCMDGTVRDLAGLHGTYRLIEQTDLAIKAMCETLGELGVKRAVIYLDAPVSNSGRLKGRIFEVCGELPFELEVLIENPVDAILKTKPLVVTADAMILDDCERWFDLTKCVIERKIGDYGFVDICGE
ncbi:DUF434 domain-containing protein [uncultured Ruminococcus sp.]|uniref:DUF434 domain-containing protein n=1 Tax=uncultured Ruminococcus sp. TaxID=165186 RepID=UPI000EB94C2E|nr:DUF434 domain-containing protein [uncultured Ruminococcus sp.]HCJ40385.1 DUF434 domain-containing protein [Ruminococcus sp.]